MAIEIKYLLQKYISSLIRDENEITDFQKSIIASKLGFYELFEIVFGFQDLNWLDS